MHAVRIHSFGDANVLKMEDIPLPEPKDNEIVVRVMAASVNPVDYKIRSGKYPAVKKDQLPKVLGRDISGVVERVGGKIGKFKKGDAIYAMLGSDIGGYAEYALVTEDEAAKKPAQLDFVQAAAVPLAALTAWQGLFDQGGLKAGQRVLIHGGAGGVGHFAVQFAKAKGAWVATTVSGQDIALARKLGADRPIDYKAESSGASNYGPTSRALLERVKAGVAAAHEANPTVRGPLSADWLTQSGSGLDPHLSPQAARQQAPRVAASRGLDVGAVNDLIARHTEGRDLGVFGEPRVNVLALNMALEGMAK